MLIEEYTEKWVEDFLKIRNVIHETLTNLNVLVEHVGSTAIPGLASKPIIDIDLVFSEMDEFNDIKMRLIDIGYFHNGNQGIKDREVFKRDNSVPRHSVLDVIDHHLYVSPSFSEEYQKHILFRDYLKAHAKTRTQYQNLKYEIASETNQDRKKYGTLKELKATTFINDIIQKAKIEKRL